MEISLLVLAVPAVSISILLVIIRKFQWKKFRKSLKLSRRIRKKSGNTISGKILISLYKGIFYALNFCLQLIRFSLKCALKTSKAKI